jgi:thiamine-phosphate pyrophosphorylase
VRKAIGDRRLIAIGGITQENAAAVIDAGADSIALVSAVLSGGPTVISDRYRTLSGILSR